MKFVYTKAGIVFICLPMLHVQGATHGGVVDEIDNLIDDLHLTDKKNTQSQSLSGGMKRKLRYILRIVVPVLSY